MIEYYRLCRPAPKPKAAKKRASALARLGGVRAAAAHLLTPRRRRGRSCPLVGLFEELLDAARAAGATQPRFKRSHVAGFVLEAIMFNAFSATIAGVSVRANAADAAEELWDLVYHGLATDAAD